MTAILGIDIAKATFDVMLVREATSSQHAQFANSSQGFNKLRRWLKKRQVAQVHACLEATGRYGEMLADWLYQQGHDVSVVNPARIKAYGESQLRRNKTDKADAALIADFCRTQNPLLWSPPDPSWRELNSLVRHLEDLTVMRQQERNRLTSGVGSPTVLDNLKTHITFLDQQIEQVKQRIQDHLDQHPKLKQQKDLLISIKGIGPLTAGKLLAEFRDIADFDNVRQLVAFAGLNPKQRQSGSSIRAQTSISKMGRASIRATLYMPALVAKRYNPVLQPFVQRLQVRGLSNMEIVIAVMRKLLHLAYGILKSGLPFDPCFLEKQAAMA